MIYLNDNQKKMMKESFILNEFVPEAITLLLVLGIYCGSEYVANYKKNKEKKKKDSERKEIEEKEKAEGKVLADKYNIHDFKAFKKFIQKEISVMIQKLNASSKIKQAIRDSIDDMLNKHSKEEIEKDPDLKYYVKNTPKLVCNVLDNIDNELSFIIIDETQDISICLSWVIYDIKEVFEVKYKSLLKYLDVNISTGDGDEGCIYFMNYKKKINESFMFNEGIMDIKLMDWFI